MSDDVKPCPFCNGDKNAPPTKAAFIGPVDDATWFVRCGWCRAFGPDCPTKEKAIAAWNRRASPALPGGEPTRDEVEQAMAEIDEAGLAGVGILDAVRKLITELGKQYDRGWDNALETRKAELASAVSAAPQETTDTERLDWILARAFLCPVEDGETIGLFIGEAVDDKLLALAIVADTDDDGEGIVTKEAAPWLTDEQRSVLSGTHPGPRDGIIDKAALRRAIDAARHADPRNGDTP